MGSGPPFSAPPLPAGARPQALRHRRLFLQGAVPASAPAMRELKIIISNICIYNRMERLAFLSATIIGD